MPLAAPVTTAADLRGSSAGDRAVSQYQPTALDEARRPGQPNPIWTCGFHPSDVRGIDVDEVGVAFGVHVVVTAPEIGVMVRLEVGESALHG